MSGRCPWSPRPPRCRWSASVITDARRLPAGGGGGGDLTDLIRTDFKPVLLWRGRVKLDAQGRAEIDVPLANSLSAYKLVAIATAGGDLFGTGSATIRTVQDLTIYPGLPLSSARATNMGQPSR